jgi:hypothetical protein
MTREYQTLIGDGREPVTVTYEIVGDPDDFNIEIQEVWLADSVGIAGCLLTQQIVDLEMEIISHHEKLMSGMADI